MPGLRPAVVVPMVHLKENVSLNIVSMKIGKLRIKVLVVAFALLATAGWGECFAQAGGRMNAINERHVVKDGGRYAVLSVRLNTSSGYSANLQRTLGEMVFGTGAETVAKAYADYLGRFEEVADMKKAKKAKGLHYRCRLDELEFVPGRYAVFHSIADGDYTEFASEKEPKKGFGYVYKYIYAPATGFTGHRLATHEKYMVYDFGADKPLAVADVFTPEGIKALGLDTLRGYVSVGLRGDNLLYGNEQQFSDVKIKAVEAHLANGFKQLIDYSARQAGAGRASGGSGEKVFDVCEQMPQFPGGDAALFEYLADNIEYPAECEADGIQGRVIVTFIVETDGSITNIKVAKSVHPLLDDEAVRVIKSMPKWTPGKQNGKAVRVKYTTPVTFRQNK